MEADRRQHSLAENWNAVVTREAETTFSGGPDDLSWDMFQKAWNRSVREIVRADRAG